MVAIYNQSVAVNTASWDTEPQTVPERRAWFEERSAAGQAILIAEVAGRVVGDVLIDRPVVVLSNNDGCCVARSAEAKALGIRMGQPFFEVRDLLASNGPDRAIRGPVPESLGLEATRFMDNPLVVIAPPDHPLTRRKSVSVEELAAESFLVREAGSGTRGAMERFFAARGLEIHSSMEMSSNEAVKQAVQAGLGLGILSLQTLDMELALKRLAVLKVEGFPIIRHWYVVHRADKRLSPAAQAFKSFVLHKA